MIDHLEHIVAEQQDTIERIRNALDGLLSEADKGEIKAVEDFLKERYFQNYGIREGNEILYNHNLINYLETRWKPQLEKNHYFFSEEFK